MDTKGLYLGTRVPGGEQVIVPAAELTTHALCVGMTGSGKTGLCSVLLEEVLEEGVPVIAVDPKGDLGNLLLPLDPDDPAAFVPWVDREQARREGKTPEALGAEAAARARAGLAASGLSRAELLAYRSGHDARLYTPGSTAGIPVDVVGSLAPPPGGAEEQAGALDAQLRAILGLLRIDADPVRSREYLLLSELVSRAWREGRTLSLAELVRLAAEPELEAVGALPLEVFFPKKERLPLALALNGLVASAPFAAWRQGEPLDPERMLRAPDGRPRLSVFSTAHLAEDERLFATALLLERVLAWVRKQPGSSGLRAVLYVDEIFGYFPPHPYDPPTKRPLLTLLKQARAFGLGVVLATQNPVDLDYKGLANIGTWLVGRLQTDQDKARIREGLEGAAAAGGTTLADVERLLSSVEQRVFLHHSIHRGAPSLLRSRWAYSFLRGPLSREELERLAAATTPAAAPAPAAAATPAPATATPPAPAAVGVDPSLGPLWSAAGGDVAAHVYVKAAVRWRMGRIATDERVVALAFPLAAASSPGEALEAAPVAVAEGAVVDAPPQAAAPRPAPPWLGETKAAALSRVVKDRLAAKLEATLFLDPETKLLSAPGEAKEAFLARVQAAQQGGKAAAAFGKKLDKKRRDLAAAQVELEGRKQEKLASIAGAVLDNVGLVFGKKRRVSGVSTVLSKNRQENAMEARVEALAAEVAALEAELARAATVDPSRLVEQRVAPGGRDLSVLRLAIAYL